MTQLKISDSLKLPSDALTETFAVLGKRGSGKTNFAVVLVEELVGAKLPVVVIDPVGVWWGLRAAADAKSEGLPVTILGGEHGDVPLEEGAGAVIADFVIEAQQPCVLDLSLLRKGQQVTFMTAFAERLYHAKATHREALHVVIDEADAFAPQRPQPNEARMLGAIEDLVRRGRSRGLGLTLITQRPASLNKNVLSQAEVLVVFQMMGKHDREAIDGWVKMNGDEEKRADLMKSMASLPVGTAWFWSPSWLDVFQKVGVRRRWTFDSSATPKAGAKRIEPRVLAPVDLEALRGRIADTIERKKADDPKELRRRIAELEAKVGNAEPTIERVEVLVIYEPVMRAVAETIRGIDAAREMLAAQQRALIEALAQSEIDGAKAASPAMPSESTRTSRAREPLIVKVPTTLMMLEQDKQRAAASASGLGKCERSILTVLAQHGTRTKVQIAILAGYSHTSGGFRNSLSTLRTQGFIEGAGDAITITETGRSALGTVEPLPRGKALLEYWMTNAGGKCERMILGELASVHPRALPKEAVANRTGYQVTSGGFRNALSRLRTLQLIKGSRELVIAEALAKAS